MRHDDEHGATAGFGKNFLMEEGTTPLRTFWNVFFVLDTDVFPHWVCKNV